MLSKKSHFQILEVFNQELSQNDIFSKFIETFVKFDCIVSFWELLAGITVNYFRLYFYKGIAIAWGVYLFLSRLFHAIFFFPDSD